MLIIRKAQMEALNKPFVAEFREHVTEYLYTYYGEKCKEMGPQGIDALIDQGIAKANRYGIEMEEEVLDLIEIMFETLSKPLSAHSHTCHSRESLAIVFADDGA